MAVASAGGGKLSGNNKIPGKRYAKAWRFFCAKNGVRHMDLKQLQKASAEGIEVTRRCLAYIAAASQDDASMSRGGD